MNKKLDKLIKQNQATNSKFSAANMFRLNRFGPLVFLLVFTALGSAFVYSSSAATVTKPSATNQAGMSITPSKQKLRAGDSLTVSVWVNSRDVAVNAVQAVIDYPADKLQYVSNDSNSSKFAVQAQAGESQGRITIARGATTPLTGDQLVATIVFRATDKAGNASLKFDSSSVLLNSTTNTNILGKLTGGSYQIGN